MLKKAQEEIRERMEAESDALSIIEIAAVLQFLYCDYKALLLQNMDVSAPPSLHLAGRMLEKLVGLGLCRDNEMPKAEPG